MAERPGSRAAAVIIGGVTLVGASVGTVVALDALLATGANTEPLWGVVWLGLAAVVFLVGSWWAWRVGSGRSWARGRPLAAAVIGLVALLLTAILAIAAAVTFSSFMGLTPDPARGGVLTVAAVAVFLGGLVSAWLLGTGRVLPRRTWVPTHQVPAGGMKAFGNRDASGESANLPEHLPLRLDEVIGGWAKVTGANGASGWVEAGLLVPLSTPQPEPPVPEAWSGEGGR